MNEFMRFSWAVQHTELMLLSVTHTLINVHKEDVSECQVHLQKSTISNCFAISVHAISGAG